eukprot:7682969-Ditylum_brightwellii.AAC.1
MTRNASFVALGLAFTPLVTWLDWFLSSDSSCSLSAQAILFLNGFCSSAPSRRMHTSKNSFSVEELESKPSFLNSSFHWKGIPSSKRSTNSSREIFSAVTPSGTGKLSR